MRGPLIDAVLIAVVVAVVLLATAHWWGPLAGRTGRRIGMNLDIAGAALFRGVRRMLGQGQARPHKDAREPGKGKGELR